MALTQKQRNEIRYALEDVGIPEVLAFMAARNTTDPDPGAPKDRLAALFTWHKSPEGDDFWRMAAAEGGQTCAGRSVQFPTLSDWS